MKIGIISQNKEVNITGINRVTLGTLTELQRIDDKMSTALLVILTGWG